MYVNSPGFRVYKHPIKKLQKALGAPMRNRDVISHYPV